MYDKDIEVPGINIFQDNLVLCYKFAELIIFYVSYAINCNSNIVFDYEDWFHRNKILIRHFAKVI